MHEMLGKAMINKLEKTFKTKIEIRAKEIQRQIEVEKSEQLHIHQEPDEDKKVLYGMEDFGLHHGIIDEESEDDDVDAQIEFQYQNQDKETKK